ncbi:MAG TPA: DUF2157 domain-containing protein [Thermoanaerobaculia bacterium]|jgi:hypothetical protein
MLSFEPELEHLRPLLPPRTADALIARERREVFSVHPELRICAWSGAMLLATAAGIVLAKNFDRIGPLALGALIGAAAVACYAFVWIRRARASLVDEYVLLLGALLVSSDAAFIETQFKLFGDAWYRHFLILTFVHGAGAYLYRSRTLLTLALAAMSAWLGVTRSPVEDVGLQRVPEQIDFAARAFGAALIALMWRAVDLRYRAANSFTPVFEHVAANLASAAAFALMLENDTRITGCLLGMSIAAAIIWWGFRTKRELFVLYGFVYAVIAADTLLIDLMDSEAFGFLLIIASMIGAIVTLFAIHSRFREVEA